MMEFKQLFGDDRAVSPVIGVILMVAITVILAAVIGTFVLGLGDQVQSTTPQASFGFETSNIGDGNANDTFTVTHESGDSIDTGDLTVKVGNTNVYEQGTAQDGTTAWSGDSVSAGSQLTYDEAETGAVVALDGEMTVRVIYDSPDSDTTSTIGKQTFDFDN